MVKFWSMPLTLLLRIYTHNGHHHVMPDEIVNHKKDVTAVRLDDGYVVVNG